MCLHQIDLNYQYAAYGLALLSCLKIHRSIGRGIARPLDTKANTLSPQPQSSALNMYGANSGNANTARQRRKTEAARALAAKGAYGSTMYIWTHCMAMVQPTLETKVPILGSIQWQPILGSPAVDQEANGHAESGYRSMWDPEIGAANSVVATFQTRIPVERKSQRFELARRRRV